MRTCVLIKILIILFIQNGLAQAYNYVSYTTRDGLASNMVYDMCQDEQGFLWFGTDNGLSRFDGKNFVNYTVRDGIMDNEIIHLGKDSKGRIWLGTFNHELVYYYHGRFFSKFNDSILGKVKLSSRPLVFHEEPNQTLWIVCQNQIFFWPKNDVLRNYKINRAIGRSESDNSFTLKNVFVGAKLGVSVNDSIYTLNGEHFQFHSKTRTKSGAKLISIINSKMDTSIISIEHDIIRITGREYVPNFIGTVDGAYEIDTNKVAIISSFLPGKGVTRAMIDSEGNYWFSTLGDGVYKLASKTALTYSITNELSALNEVFSIGKRNDSILTGHSGGRVAIWKQGKLKDVISYQEYLPKVDNSISTNRLKAIIPLPDGAWLLGFDGFLILQKKGVRKLLPMTATKTIDFVNDSIVLVATGEDVKHVNLKRFAVSRLVWPTRASAAVQWNGSTVIGTLGGLKVPDNTLLSGIIEKQKILQRRIISLNKYKSSLWVATSDSGLVELTPSGVGRTLSEKDGLPSNNCRAVCIDGDIMWVGTSKGLARVNLLVYNDDISIFNQFNLLPNNAISSIFAHEGEVFVGSPSGLTIFEPAKTSTSSICGLSIDAIVGSSRKWEPEEKIIIPYNDNFLQVKFAGISAKSAGNIDYFFLLKGLDDQWNHTLANEITYSNLPPGKYTFQLFAKNKFGVKSEVKSFEIEVEAPFYKTRWFFAMVLLLGMGMIYLFAYTRIRFKHEKAEAFNKVQRQIADLEQKALQAQMNPHFIFNSLNSIQQYIVTNNLENANKYLSIFALLIRETLENSSLADISISKEIQYLEKYLLLEQLRFGNRFSFKIITESLPDLNGIKIPVMLLQPYVENAVRHGMRYRLDEKGLIVVEFTMQNNILHCFIRDNGPGRQKTESFHSRQHIEYQSRGMHLTARRIELLNLMQGEKLKVSVQDLVDSQGAVCGTEVHLLITQIENNDHDKHYIGG